MATDYDILQNSVEQVTNVERAVGIRRSIVNDNSPHTRTPEVLLPTIQLFTAEFHEFPLTLNSAGTHGESGSGQENSGGILVLVRLTRLLRISSFAFSSFGNFPIFCCLGL